MNDRISRKSFLKGMALVTGATVAASVGDGNLFAFTEPLKIDNPLDGYPSRDWEKQYRDLYSYDSTFNFLCAPNDTHNCLLTVYEKNGVAVRIGPSFGFGKATDIYGNKSTHRWDPRCCQKGISMVRRFYGERRCKEPMVRKGFLDWYKSGFERDPVTGAAPAKYMQRGKDSWVKVTWDEAFEMEAKAAENIARTYTGEQGKKFLSAQGYDSAMIDGMNGIGVRTMKFRGGMAALGATRVFAQYRAANMMALLDSKIRGVGPDKAVGATGWDNYSWHTDLPPGHPMVTGFQTSDWDLVNAENAGLIMVWGMNWIATKMPDSHWLTEARLKGTKVAVIAAEYSATANKADYAMVVRPGTSPALALGFCNMIIKNKAYDEQYLRRYTDLAHLVRLDTLELLKASDVWADYKPAELSNYMEVLKPGDKMPPPVKQKTPLVDQKMREQWGDFVVMDLNGKKPVPLTRDDYGSKYDSKKIKSALEGTFQVTLKDGKKVKVRPSFDLTKEYVAKNFTEEAVCALTWATPEGLKALYGELIKNKGKTLFACGMGPNQFFNNDLKDRATFLLAALTDNIGRVGGNVGSLAGNYRAAYFSGMPGYISEDPFNIQTDPSKPPSIHMYWKGESVHYFNHGDNLLRMGKEVVTGKSHIPVPTKFIHVSNSNSLIGNIKGHFDLINNTLPRVEFLAVNEWWWTTSCEYADIVFPVDSWAEFKHPDMTISVTNPFLYVFPRTPLKRIYNTRSDIEVAAGFGNAMAKLTGDDRYSNMWKFVNEDNTVAYLQRILNNSNSTKGYKFEDLEEKAKQGIPSLLMTRTYPKLSSWEQRNEDRPYYTKTGRLEFYRDEKEFIDAGENLIVYREPIDSTFYEPNVIVSHPHEALRPRGPASYGVDANDVEGDVRQARNVIKDWKAVLKTKHPLIKDGFKFIFHTPKYRHGAHTTGVDTDIVGVWFGPFGDMYRNDKRTAFVAEAYIDINPADAKELGIQHGDYVYVDADPKDRPFRKWKKGTDAYEAARLLCRARHYPGTPRGVTRMWHNMAPATFGTVKGTKVNPSGLAQNPETKYISFFRRGSHQSCTRGWLKPTHMTDSLTRKDPFGQHVGKGMAPDVHCPTGAPRESFIRITKAEDGGLNGKGLWGPARKGFTHGYESKTMKDYLKGGFVS